MKTLKLTIYTFTAVYMLVFILVCTGRVNYVNAQDEITSSDAATDADICDVLSAHGFNLDWNDRPTVSDYLLSNFYNTSNKDINY